MRQLLFQAPGEIAMVEGLTPTPAAEQLLVRTRWSAISPGTEMLVYRGQWPKGVPLDANIAALRGDFRYPLSYGYAAVGQVVAAGHSANDSWLGRRVFAFHPHQDHFCATPAELFPIPSDVDEQTALLLPSMETAVSLVQDGQPLLGEMVAVLGQGIIGLLTTALLAQFPLHTLLTLDGHSLRRTTSLAMGASDSRDPGEPGLLNELGAATATGGKADLVYELSGEPVALDTAIALARFSGRVVIGSWYGEKRTKVNLGSWFHRGRLQLLSSQVSSVGPELAGRWQPARRMALAWRMLLHLKPGGCITHRFPLEEAAAAYALIDSSPGETIQVILDHGEDGQ